MQCNVMALSDMMISDIRYDISQAAGCVSSLTDMRLLSLRGYRTLARTWRLYFSLFRQNPQETENWDLRDPLGWLAGLLWSARFAAAK